MSEKVVRIALIIVSVLLDRTCISDIAKQSIHVHPCLFLAGIIVNILQYAIRVIRYDMLEN